MHDIPNYTGTETQRLALQLQFRSRAEEPRINRHDSLIVAARGGAHFREYLKKQAYALVSLKTRLVDFPVAYLLRNDEAKWVRIGAFTRPVRDGLEFGRRGEWQLLKVDRAVITSMVRLG